MDFFKKNWPILLLITISFFVYAFNLHNKLFWDDDDWILNNKFVHTISWTNIKFWFTHNTLAGVGQKSNYYRPFLFLTYAINYIISGKGPLSYHLFSNFIHIGNGILVFFILSRFFKQRLIPFLTSLFFLIHPLQTEAVTYIAGRGDPLYVFFSLLTLWLFIRAEESSNKKLLYKLLSLGSLTLGLLSREVAIIFPFLLVSFYIAFLSKENKFWPSLKLSIIKSAPYLALVLIYGILRLTVLNFVNTLNFFSVHTVYSDHLYVRIFTFLKVLVVYFGLLFAPVGLHMERGIDPQLSFFKWPVWFMFFMLVIMVGGLVWLYKKSRLQKNDNYFAQVQTSSVSLNTFKIWFFGLSWFFIALGPVSGVTPINAILYEHWLYLPMLGIFFLISFYLVKLIVFLRLKNKTMFLVMLLVGLVVYLSFFVFQSVKRNILWGKPIDFYSDILKYEPDSVRINNNLGNLYFNQGNTQKAREFYEKAVESEDIFPQPHFNLGGILESKGDIYGAIKEYEKAVNVDPNFYYPYPNLITIYARQGNLEKASEYVAKLDELRPNDPRVLYNSALIYAAQGKFDLALQKAQRGLLYVGVDTEVKKALQDIITKLQKKSK